MSSSRSPGGSAGNALAAHAQLPAALRARGDAHVERAAGQVHRTTAPSAASHGATGRVSVQVAAVGPQARMRLELHFEQQVAGLAAAHARRALAREADDLAFADALRESSR